MEKLIERGYAGHNARAVSATKPTAAQLRAERVAARFGKQVVWVEGLNTAGLTFRGLDRGVIFLNPDSGRSAQVLTAHELAHHLAGENQQAFAKLAHVLPTVASIWVVPDKPTEHSDLVAGTLPMLRAFTNSKVGSAATISKADAGVVADLITGKWSKDSPAVEFVSSFKDLPQDVKDSVDKETTEQEKTKGIYHPKSNSIWVVLDKHATARTNSRKFNAQSFPSLLATGQNVAPTTTVSQKDADIAVRAITGLWHGDTAKVHLAPTFSSLPKEVGHHRKVAQMAPAGDLNKIVKPLLHKIIFSIARVYAGSSGVVLRNFTLVAKKFSSRYAMKPAKTKPEKIKKTIFIIQIKI